MKSSQELHKVRTRVNLDSLAVVDHLEMFCKKRPASGYQLAISFTERKIDDICVASNPWCECIHIAIL